ncbi:MAG: DUF1294 domain-containing protein [Cellulosilyticum sp.]|nr:DUF1294 domain-containing protein [Cellulosilyticum sp.]
MKQFYFILLCIVIMNLWGYFSMWSDKRRAIKGKYRISEKALFMIAIFGGSIGSIIGMNRFRHKTKHWYFKYGMPMILMIQIVVVAVAINFFV